MSDEANSRLRIGEVFRYNKSFPTDESIVDGLPNFIYVTGTEGRPNAQLESGINPIGSIGECPAILISSSSHKHGSKESPWQDEFDVDQGFVRYFGDNKSPLDPSKSSGNKSLLEQFAFHKSGLREERLKAAPILLFSSVKVGTRVKGNRVFQGVALIKSAERISQYQKDRG